MRAISEFSGVFLHREPVDMRKAINGLSEIVQSERMGELMGPHLFVFCGRKKNSIKVLYFDKSGFALWQKRLEKDKFPWPKRITDQVLNISTEQFSWLLDGFDIWKIKSFEKLYFEKVS